MMVSIQPAPPGSGSSLDNPITPSSVSSPLSQSSGTVTPDPMSYAAMPLLSSFDILPLAVDPSILPSPTVANYLAAARLRLLPDLPNSFHGYSVSNSMWSWWCGACGALPESWARTQRGSASGSGSRTPKRKKRKSAANGEGSAGGAGAEACAAAGAKRTADGDVKPGHIDEIEAQLVHIESELQRTISALAVPSTPSSPPLAPARKPPSALHRRRKPTACVNCGLSTSLRTWTTIDLPPARTVARTRSQTMEVSANAEPGNFIVPTPSGLSSVSTSESATPDPSSSVSTPDSGASADVFVPVHTWVPGRPVRFFPTPSLQRISTSPGDLPTYPRPPVVPPPSPSGSSPAITIPPSGGQLPPAKKRKKKSGLAKLLAQNAQREAEGTGSGNWGLG